MNIAPSVPKTLTAFCQRAEEQNPGCIHEVYVEGDEDLKYWVILATGWVVPSTQVHAIHEGTVRSAAAELKLIKPCTCSDCAKQPLARL